MSDGIGQYILDEHGQPKRCDTMEWGRWLQTADRIVCRTTGVRGADISTVFLGLDHNFAFSDGPPVLWETMIFGGKFDGFQWRYSSRRDALRGHALAVGIARRHPSLPAHLRPGRLSRL